MNNEKIPVVNFKNMLSIIGILTIIVGATLTFANKADREEVRICTEKIEREYKNADFEIIKKLERSEEKLMELISSNQKEIIDILKKNNHRPR